MTFVIAYVSIRDIWFKFEIAFRQAGMVWLTQMRHETPCWQKNFSGLFLPISKEKYPQFISGNSHYPGLPWRFKRAIHVVDSTTIQLLAKCMNWAKHREQKVAAKMHLNLDLNSFLPNFAIVNRAKDSDPKMAWVLCEPIRAGEIVVFDKAYVDFAHLQHLHQKGVIWVSRAKENVCFEVMGQQLSEEEIQQAQHMYEAGIFMGQQLIVLSDCRIKLTKDDTYTK